MKIKYDKEADAIYLKLSDNEIVRTDEEKKGMMIDYDAEDNVVGIEFIEASKRTENPSSLIYEVA